MAVDGSKITQLTEDAESFYIINAYIIGSISIIAAACYTYVAANELNNSNKCKNASRYYTHVIEWAIASFVSVIMGWIMLSVFGNII